MLFLWLCWCIDQLVSSYIILKIYTIRNAINVDGANRFHDHCTGLHSLGAKRLSPTASWSFRVGGFLWQIERILWDQWGYYIIYMFLSLKWEFHSCSGPLLFVRCVYWEAFRCFSMHKHNLKHMNLVLSSFFLSITGFWFEAKAHFILKVISFLWWRHTVFRKIANDIFDGLFCWFISISLS